MWLQLYLKLVPAAMFDCHSFNQIPLYPSNSFYILFVWSFHFAAPLINHSTQYSITLLMQLFCTPVFITFVIQVTSVTSTLQINAFSNNMHEEIPEELNRTNWYPWLGGTHWQNLAGKSSEMDEFSQGPWGVPMKSRGFFQLSRGSFQANLAGRPRSSRPLNPPVLSEGQGQRCDLQDVRLISVDGLVVSTL